jgi:hypothetical protein
LEELKRVELECKKKLEKSKKKTFNPSESMIEKAFVIRPENENNKT